MADLIPVIAVDGPGGSGKGLVAMHLAGHYSFRLLDSGALYRLLGIAARQEGFDLNDEIIDETALAELGRKLDVSFSPTGQHDDPLVIRLSGEDVTRRVRSDEAGADASVVAAIQGVRESLITLQKSFRRSPGLVADGRDMGTSIFPDAAVKIYLTASSEVRAARRYNQLKDKDIGVNLHDLFESIRARDERDMSRSASPLKPAADAHVIDSTTMTTHEVISVVEAIVAKKLG